LEIFMKIDRVLNAFPLIIIGAAMAPLVAAQPGATVYEGLVKPSRQVVMKAPVEDRVASIPVRESQSVTAGQVLAQMDDRVQRTAYELARLRAADRSTVEFAELGLAEAELRLEQASAAHARDAANELEVQSARIARDQAQVRLKAARELLRQTQVEMDLEQRRLEQYTIEAPFDGIVTRIQTEAGASLTREEPILELVSLDPLEAEVYVPAERYGELEIGAAYSLLAGAPVDAPLSATLDRVVPVIDPGSRRFRAVFVIDNADDALPSGFPVALNPEALSRARQP
jgi:RND family efflux transporter MFP subunit